MPIKFPDGNGGITLIGSEASNYFEDEVSLHGGVSIWEEINLKENNTITGNATLTGKHTFTDKITLKSGVHTSDSMKSDFGDYGTIKATNDTIRIDNSTITGNATFTDQIRFKGGLYIADSMKSDFGDHSSIRAAFDTINVAYSTITGNSTLTGKINFSDKVTLQGVAEFQDDIKVADSLRVDLGSSGKIFASHDVINVAGSTIKGDHSVDGNIYFEQKQHFLDPIIAHDGVSLIGELSGADSLKHDFGNNCTIAARHDTLDFRYSYVRLDGATLSGNSIGGGSDYILPTASTSTKGGIKIGNGLSMNGDTLNVVQSGGGYTLPTASNSVKGGIKIGKGLNMNGDTLNVVQSNTVILDTVPSTVEGAMWYVL